MSDSSATPPARGSGSTSSDQLHEPREVAREADEALQGQSGTGRSRSRTAGPGAFADPEYVESTRDASAEADTDTSEERIVRADEPTTPEPGGVIAPGVGVTTTGTGPQDRR